MTSPRLLPFVRAATLSIATSFATSSCATLMTREKDGLQQEFASHIPARTAVLPCQVWMNVRLSSPDQKLLCDKLDEAVTDGFRTQPYMRGFSPKVVARLLDQAKWPEAVKEGFEIVETAATNAGCVTGANPFCASVASLYSASLANNPAWQMWLARFSDTQKHADAVLVPILASATDTRGNDRGLVAMSRSVNFSLWLVDTNSGKLIWARTKSGSDTVRALPEKSASLTVPAWDVPVKRALTQDFWRDYPGRLVLD